MIIFLCLYTSVIMAAPINVSQETENFWRAIDIVLNEVPRRLRTYFVQEWDKKYPNNPWDDTATSGNIFWQGK